MAKNTYRGICDLCKTEFGKSQMTRHLTQCVKTAARIAKKGNSSKAEVRQFHLLIESAAYREFWIHLLLPADSTLRVLDEFLRDLWLECCGHMSAFEIDSGRYSSSPMRELDEESMSSKLDQVLSPGATFQ